jgi:acetyl esterase/lipase
MTRLLIFYFFIMMNFAMMGQNILPLWSEVVPNSKPTDEEELYFTRELITHQKVQSPTIEVFLPTKRNANGKAVILFPGGGYGGLAYDWEGTDFAKWLNSKGIAAFVVKYRLPQSHSVVDASMAPLQDAQRAIRLVRSNAKLWDISEDKIGIMGFSAGGHLASSLGTHYQDKVYEPTDEIDRASAKPDFMISVYPVITMDPAFTHQGSKDNLLGKNPKPELVKYFSNELQVNSNTPPTFLVHSADDGAVPATNSILFYQALERSKVYSELHIYPFGGHGFGLALDGHHLATWTDRLNDWIQSLDRL